MTGVALRGLTVAGGVATALLLLVPALSWAQEDPGEEPASDRMQVACEVQLEPDAQLVRCRVSQLAAGVEAVITVTSEEGRSWAGNGESSGQPMVIETAVPCAEDGPVRVEVSAQDGDLRQTHAEQLTLPGECLTGWTFQHRALIVGGILAVTIVAFVLSEVRRRRPRQGLHKRRSSRSRSTGSGRAPRRSRRGRSRRR